MHFGTIEGAGMFLTRSTAVFRLPAFTIKTLKQTKLFLDNDRIYPQLMNNELQMADACNNYTLHFGTKVAEHTGVQE